jgi:hypothetical protein
MASKSARQAAILPLKQSHNAQVSIDADVLVRKFFEQFMAFAKENHIGIMARGDQTDIQERRPMASAVKEPPARSNGRQHGAPLKRTKLKLPEGRRWVARFARGLILWRITNGLGIDDAAKKYGIDRSAWYRVERAVSNGITASHVDEICEAIGVDIVELLKLGKPNH